MPFKSEKQRRYLWAVHPDIAKEWAHKYPKSNKNLPLYAHKDDKDDKTDSKEKAAALMAKKAHDFNVSRLISQIAGSPYCPSASILTEKLHENCKKADSKQEIVDIQIGRAHV